MSLQFKKQLSWLLLVFLLSACAGAKPGSSQNQANQAPGNRLELIWSSTGDPDTFTTPDGIGLDQQGNLYVSDAGNYRIQKLDSQGKMIAKWGSQGKSDGQLDCWPCGLAVDGKGNVFITDTNNSRIQKFDSKGKFLAKWGSSGTDDGQFKGPFGLAVDRQGNVYVADVGNARIQKFDNNGKYLAKWGSSGAGNGQFTGDLADLAVDGQGNVYVTDRSTGLQKFDSAGKFVAWLDNCGDSKPIAAATGVAADSKDNIYVYDMSNSRICKFDSSGRFKTAWGGLTNAVGFIAVDQQGNLYLAEPFNHLVKKFKKP